MRTCVMCELLQLRKALIQGGLRIRKQFPRFGSPVLVHFPVCMLLGLAGRSSL